MCAFDILTPTWVPVKGQNSKYRKNDNGSWDRNKSYDSHLFLSLYLLSSRFRSYLPPSLSPFLLLLSFLFSLFFLSPSRLLFSFSPPFPFLPLYLFLCKTYCVASITIRHFFPSASVAFVCEEDVLELSDWVCHNILSSDGIRRV